MLRFRATLTLFTSGAVRAVGHSKEFMIACRDLPTTPSGRNPYDVLEMDIAPSTTMEDVSKHFRSLVVKYHPDKPGGSTDKMSEINLAYTIVKDNHDKVLSKMTEVGNNVKANAVYRQHKHERAIHDEELRHSGGVYRRNTKAALHPSYNRPRSLKEIELQWEKYRDETGMTVKSMCNRYEVAIQLGRFLRKSTNLNEISARERWLRKSFIKSIWENVHELRGELLRRGARSAQQSELAESMVSFASVTQRKLNEDFQRLTQQSVQSQSRMFLQRVFLLMCISILLVKFWKLFFLWCYRATSKMYVN
ncbi:unnamed protein product [Phytomonas sp. Hart1]|nr:unnamed protein product [Phytomonas sp. Hart1]|eukprot:CCW70559.1 unnamed protein product [Phytomonas sp. isolate Hart1]